MKIEEISPKIILVKCPTQKELGKLFVRFSEYTESPFEEIKGKIFTLGYYKKLYSERNGSGGFSYYTDWTGYNIPSSSFQPFIIGLFDPLTKPERDLVELLRCRTDKYSVIGVFEGKGIDSLNHEIAHAFYYTNEDYKNEVDAILKHPDLDKFKDMIQSLGYADNVLQDEVHAYFGVDGQWLKNNRPEWLEEYNIKFPEKMHKKLVEVFNKYKTF